MNAMNVQVKKFHHIMLILLAGSYDYAFGLCKMDFILLHINLVFFFFVLFFLEF